uniref:O-methyltransferase domain-containing protein n=1 Tax=Araucaria cunninghamii TaxID=56994 RepID=A0A0D6QSW5_ARACU
MASSKIEELSAHLEINEIMLSTAKPMALKAAVLLNVPDIIAIHGNGNALSVEQIASFISFSTNKPAHEENLFRILKFLASIGVFTEEKEEGSKEIVSVAAGSNSQYRKYKYGLTNLSRILVKKDNQKSCAPILLFVTHKLFCDSYQHLHESVIAGCYPFNKAHDMSLWEYVSNNPEFSRTFNQGMASHSNDVMAHVVEVYSGFNSLKRLVDVGGGVGSASSLIVKQHPHIHCINFDLPHVIASARPVPGVEHVGGNMFEQIPSTDAVFVKWVLHDWDDEQCIKLLKKCYEATPPEGKVLIVEAVIDEKQGSMRRTGLLYDMLMMACTEGGRERTEEEFKELFCSAGFKSCTFTKLPFLQALIEVSKT